MITPEITAKEIYDSFYYNFNGFIINDIHSLTKNCSINCVQRILCANPHSNPLNNVEVTSTFDFWNKVMDCLKKM